MSTLVTTNRDPGPEVVDRKKLRGSRLERVVKRIIDIGGACCAIVLLSPILLISVVLIKIADRGPVLYRRRVVGQRGEFDAFKLRSMRTDADRVLENDPALRAEYEQSFKLRSDPRVTKVGALLRKYSLDELPQLFNVLSGKMSLVGPRMITMPELQKYGEREYLLRTVKPGLTGYWQVNGRQQTSYAERVAMDSYYIENWSLLLDLKILLATPLKVLKGEGAY